MRKLVVGVVVGILLSAVGVTQAVAKERWTTVTYTLDDGCQNGPVIGAGVNVPYLESRSSADTVTFVTNGPVDQIGLNTTTFVTIHCVFQGPPIPKTVEARGFACGASFGTRSANFGGHDSFFEYPRTGRDVWLTCKGQLGVFS